MTGFTDKSDILGHSGHEQKIKSIWCDVGHTLAVGGQKVQFGQLRQFGQFGHSSWELGQKVQIRTKWDNCS